jgi:PIN domain nuclease of toxin-antitoxin system
MAEPRYLADTHIVVRWMIDSSKLSRQQLRVLEDAARRHQPVALSAITLLEIAVLHAEGRLRLAQPIEEFFDAIESSPAFRLLPLTYSIAAEAGGLGVLRDPADRVIVATARVHRLKLVTSDQRIIESNTIAAVE